MKKLILLLFIAALGTTACKKEENASPRLDLPLKEGIIGVWITTAETHDYYNASNEKVFTRTVEPGWNYKVKEDFKITDPQDKLKLTSAYTVSNSNGKNYFSFTANGTAETYEIASLTQKTMAWKQEKTNVVYNDNGEKTAAKVVTTIDFTCPCK